MNRTLVLNPTEPGPLNVRWPQGVDLQLQVTLLDLDDGAVDPGTVLPVLKLLPRSGGATQTYPMPTYDAGNGICSVHIDGASLRDPLGYSIQLYASNATEPVSLIGTGTLAIRVGAYAFGGALV